MTLRIKDWGSFQHFKDRSPPWVKLYRGLLDDVEWHELDPRAAKALVMLWLIASEDGGNLPSTKKLAFRLRLTELEVGDVLGRLSHWLESSDITPISTGHQPVSAQQVSGHQETETEEEIEAKKEKEKEAQRLAAAAALAEAEAVKATAAAAARKEYFEEFWKAYPKKIGKDDARKSFEKRKPSRTLLDAMLAAIVVASATDQWQRERGQFIPNPATWLNQGRWQDGGVEVATTVPSKKERDPALLKLDRDSSNASKPNAETAAAIAALLGRRPVTP